MEDVEEDNYEAVVAVHSNLSDTAPQDAGTSLNREAFKTQLIKCLELGVVIGVVMACCSVFYSIYGHIPLTSLCGAVLTM